MASLSKARGGALLLCLVTLVYATVVTLVPAPPGHHLTVQGDAHIGLTPRRRGLLNSDVAVIVPYRDKKIHLGIFINYMSSFLFNQKSSARIYVVEQDGIDEFNRAKLFNVGYTEAKKDFHYSCFIFHDIDLLPLNASLIYRCGNHPLYLSAYIDVYNYRLNMSYSGGVFSFSEQQLKEVNGFSNSHWGSGSENDDMAKRIEGKKYTMKRPPANLARYTMLRLTGKPTKSKPSKDRKKILQNAEANMAKDGLSNLDYRVINKGDNRTYIWILADLKHNVGIVPPR